MILVDAIRHRGNRSARGCRPRPVLSRCWWAVTGRCLVLVTGLLLPAVGHAEDRAALAEKAIDLYRDALDNTDRAERLEQFRRAELLFAQLVEGSDEPGNEFPAVENVELYVNLGNAALGAERLGPAILAYRRALELAPDHGRAEQNLRHARSLLPDWLPRPESVGLFDTFFSWAQLLSITQWNVLAALLFVVTAALLASAIRWRSTALRTLGLGAGLLWLAAFLAVPVRARMSDDRDAVVVVSEIVARAADSPNAPARFAQPLPGGAEVLVMRSIDGWSRVRLADAREAWVPSSSVSPVKRP